MIPIAGSVMLSGILWGAIVNQNARHSSSSMSLIRFGNGSGGVPAVLLAVLLLNSAVGGERAKFRTFFVTRSLGHERFLDYVKAARPEVVQIGNYGAMFHGYAANPRATRTPMMLPVVGERQALAFQKQLNGQVHQLGLKVVGHFRLVKVMGDWKEQSGFVDYYNNRWPRELLGPKPHRELVELLQRDADGQPIQVSRYDNAQLTLCLSSPPARRMLKGMLKCAIDHGVDGVMTTYNYRHGCVCSYCQTAFKSWLKKRLSKEKLRRLGVADLDRHRFTKIAARIPSYPDPKQATDLDWLAMRWGAEHFKQMYDDIFVTYGRSLNENLIVGQWNHLSHVSIQEERNFLPLTMWGRDEDYFWYSGGSAFVGRNLSLRDRRAGDAWLSCLYIRELGGGKPFVMGKYDRIRLAASMAEGYATGGVGMGRYMRFEQPAGYKTLVRYTRFMHRHRELYESSQPLADAALVLPRQSVWNGQPAALDSFREIGQALGERQVLLDIVADENLTGDRLRRYSCVILPAGVSLKGEQLAVLREFASGKGTLVQLGPAGTSDERGPARDALRIDGAVVVKSEPVPKTADVIEAHLKRQGAAIINAPWTVRATAYSQPNCVVLHLVNYDRDESPDKQLKGPDLERPKPVSDVTVDLRLPASQTAVSVKFHTPELDAPRVVDFQQPVGTSRVRFRVPRFSVYAVIAVACE